MVYGDTNSTLAGAIAATKLHIKVAHVEAGLRSFNKKMPEEINRVLTDHVSDLLFCPTETAVKNLEKEGITKGVYLVGDVMYDAAMDYMTLAEKKSFILEKLSLYSNSYVLATIHRAENTENKKYLYNILKGLDAISRNISPVIFPVHPRTMNKMKEYGIEAKHVRLIKPVSYLDMLVLEKNAKIIITDSGGVQKEAFFFKVPCITLRNETEWIETVKAGWNRLIKPEPDVIFKTALNINVGLENPQAYGDGHASKKIVDLLIEKL